MLEVNNMEIIIATLAMVLMAISLASDGIEIKRLRKEAKKLKDELSKCRKENG